MATRSDELTDQIRTTRTRMDRTLDDIGERAGPGRLTARVKDAVATTKDTVMGAAAGTGQHLAETGSDVAGTVRQQGRGNPLAAGLVAFGAGLLAGSVLPESRTEHALAREVQSKAQAPIREQVKQSASAVADQVGDRVDEAKETIAQEAHVAKDAVASDAAERKHAVEEHAHSAAEDVRDEVQGTLRHHTGE
ncbi:MAG TPA: hypothetical protein VFU14_04570 [Acidimicrobiales bacterium]|nr:hypothetical protein [Acidimicrobiales bacterium]